MVHYAVPEVDAGPVLLSEPVPVDPAAPLEALASAIHAVEHRLIVEATRLALATLRAALRAPPTVPIPPSGRPTAPSPTATAVRPSAATPPPPELAPARAPAPPLRAPAPTHALAPPARAPWSLPMTPRRALLSVYDKSGLVDFARGLLAQRFELIASGGTARALAAAGLPVTEVADVTGSPEILDGRVKTLHPAIHAGILSRRTPADRTALASQGYRPIDLVVVNLYPFEETVAGGEATESELIEQMDVGGVTLLRASAKNHACVTVVPAPAHYAEVLAALAAGDDLRPLNRRLALEAFRRTAQYDQAIARWLGGDAGEVGAAERLDLAFEKVEDLRYGENPHQRAALYRPLAAPAAFVQLGGKALSYNNLVDLDAARAIAADFARPTAVIVKHTNPCGLASAESPEEAFALALAGDPTSAYGGVVALNREVDEAVVEAFGKLFIEVLVAPGFTDGAVAALQAGRAGCRLVMASMGLDAGPELRRIAGGLLLQEVDRAPVDPATWTLVTERAPSADELQALVHAWRAVKHVKSNAIVLAQGEQVVGVGAGQMSRVDAVELAVRRAGPRALGSALASDAFFPFPDGLEAAAAAGVTAIVQPGGSIRDAQVIAAAERLGLAMVVTGIRHFKH